MRRMRTIDPDGYRPSKGLVILDLASSGGSRRYACGYRYPAVREFMTKFLHSGLSVIHSSDHSTSE